MKRTLQLVLVFIVVASVARLSREHTFRPDGGALTVEGMALGDVRSDVERSWVLDKPRYKWSEGFFEYHRNGRYLGVRYDECERAIYVIGNSLEQDGGQLVSRGCSFDTLHEVFPQVGYKKTCRYHRGALLEVGCREGVVTRFYLKNPKRYR